MVVDYRERKTVNKNRPRRQPAGIFFFSIFVAVIIAYTLGLMTGWLVFRHGQRSTANNLTVPAEGKIKAPDLPAPGKEQTAPENTGKVKEPMLTFYETLPKGNRELIGSGLNMPRPGEPQSIRPVPPQRPVPAAKETPPSEIAAKPREAVKATDKPNENTGEKRTAAREAPAKGDDGKGKFAVQIASYHVKKEAEELRDRLKASGIPAYIVESTITDKGTFYRVRAGRHLEQKAAQEMAEKTGKGSIIIPE